MIDFHTEDGAKINAMNWITRQFKPGSCGHFNHDANQALAEYIYKRISNE